jgi:hypothetical protein
VSEFRSLRQVQEEAATAEIRRILEGGFDVARAALMLDCHENTIRFYMKRAGITAENVREWKEARLRQRSMEFNGSK